MNVDEAVINMMKNIQNVKYYRTSDICLATAMRCIGKSIIIEKGAPRSFFLIESNKGLEEEIKAYWDHELMVDPISFFNALKEIKTRIYEA